MHAGWPAGSVPPLDTTLDLCASILEFLSKDLRHVVVVHCLDGKSSTAYLLCALLLYTRFVSSLEAAVAVFSGKRCEPQLTPCQSASLVHLASLAEDTPPVLKSPFVTLASLVLEPVPLFNKAGDGCRPYVEVWQGRERVLSSLQEYARMKSYSVTQGDEAVVLPVNSTVCGDVTIVVSHARQALGRHSPVRICQVALHTSSLTPGRPSYSWGLQQLDCLAEAQRYSPNFRLVLNCSTTEECSGRDVAWAEPSASMLLFNSDQDYEATVRLLPAGESDCSVAGLGQASSIGQASQSTFYVNNPEIAPPAPPPVHQREAPVDLLGLGGSAGAKEPELLPGFGSISPQEKAKASVPSTNLNLLDPTPPPTKEQTFDFLADLSTPTPAPAQQQDKLSDLLGVHQAPGTASPLLEMPTSSSSPNLQQNNNNFDPFSTLTGLSASLSNQTLKVSPAPTAPMKAPSHTSSGSFDPFGDLGNLGSTPKPASNPAPAPQPMGPNYSRSFFAPTSDNKPTGPANPAGPGGVKPKVSNTFQGFDDLLGGFNPMKKDDNQGKTIGQMKKAELVKTMDPEEALIMEWREGKARNIRSLLCSLHKIIFSGTRWTTCGMHELVSQGDVKKMYRKACLAVHPDKHTGTDNENISKLIFMELNEAWSEFDNDPSQQKMFG